MNAQCERVNRGEVLSKISDFTPLIYTYRRMRSSRNPRVASGRERCGARSRGHLQALTRRFDGAGGVVEAAGEALLLLLLLHPLEHLEDLEELGPLDRAVA